MLLKNINISHQSSGCGCGWLLTLTSTCDLKIFIYHSNILSQGETKYCVRAPKWRSIFCQRRSHCRPQQSRGSIARTTKLSRDMLLWAERLCIYVYRHGRKPLRNWRFGSLYSEGCLFPSRISKPFFIRLCDALPILDIGSRSMYPYFEVDEFQLSLFSKSEMKLFPNISIPLINLNPY